MFALAALMASLTGQPIDAPPAALEQIIVTGSRPNRAALGEPIDYFRRHCFDALRRDGRNAAPTVPDNPDWQPLADNVREQLGISDPAAILMGLTDHVRRHILVLRIDRLAQPMNLAESRCSLTVIGGDSHRRLQDGMAALFRGPGTQRHIGHPSGNPRLAGWDQHVWTGTPPRGSTAWRDAIPGSGRPHPGGSFIVVTDTRFFDDRDYVLGDLKTRTSGAPVISVMSLALTFRGSHRAP